MTRVFIWKNNSPQEWEEISFSAFSKARRNGCLLYTSCETSASRLGGRRWLYRHQPHHSGGLQGGLLLQDVYKRQDMGWESGWAFYSGDEGDVYGEGDEYYESHCGFYDTVSYTHLL